MMADTMPAAVFVAFTPGQREALAAVLTVQQIDALEADVRAYHTAEASAEQAPPAPTPFTPQQIENVTRAVRDVFGDASTVTVQQPTAGSGRPAYTTPAALRRQLLQAATAIDRSTALVAALPPEAAVPMPVGYGQFTRRWRGEDGARRSVQTWLADAGILSRELRDVARHLSLTKTDHAVDALNRAIGSAVFLSTGDLRDRDVRAVLKVLVQVPPHRAVAGGLVRDVRAATAEIRLSPGHPAAGGRLDVRVADVAPALAGRGRIGRRSRDSARSGSP